MSILLGQDGAQDVVGGGVGVSRGDGGRGRRWCQGHVLEGLRGQVHGGVGVRGPLFSAIRCGGVWTCV